MKLQRSRIQRDGYLIVYYFGLGLSLFVFFKWLSKNITLLSRDENIEQCNIFNLEKY